MCASRNVLNGFYELKFNKEQCVLFEHGDAKNVTDKIMLLLFLIIVSKINIL